MTKAAEQKGPQMQEAADTVDHVLALQEEVSMMGQKRQQTPEAADGDGPVIEV